MKINNFRGDPTDISAKKAALFKSTPLCRVYWSRQESNARVGNRRSHHFAFARCGAVRRERPPSRHLRHCHAAFERAQEPHPLVASGSRSGWLGCRYRPGMISIGSLLSARRADLQTCTGMSWVSFCTWRKSQQAQWWHLQQITLEKWVFFCFADATSAQFYCASLTLGRFYIKSRFPIVLPF